MTLDISVDREPPRQPGVIRLLDMSEAYGASLYPPESNHFLALEALESPGVSFFVARGAAAIIGCCALVESGDGSAELKRMFVDPAARGQGVGARLMEALEAGARERGVAVLRLEVGIRQPEALRLYRKLGYMEIGPFGDYKPDPLSIFMEKRLGASA